MSALLTLTLLAASPAPAQCGSAGCGLAPRVLRAQAPRYQAPAVFMPAAKATAAFPAGAGRYSPAPAAQRDGVREVYTAFTLRFDRLAEQIDRLEQQYSALERRREINGNGNGAGHVQRPPVVYELRTR